MASEVKRPTRPFRRKSDIPLDSSHYSDGDVWQEESAERTKSGSEVSANLEMPDKSYNGKDISVGDAEDCTLQIVENIVLRPAPPRPSHPPAAQPCLRQVRPKERHRTLSSQFPAAELQKKNDREEMVKFGSRRPVEFLQLNSISITTSESSLSKPLIKPKPSIHSIGQQITGQSLNNSQQVATAGQQSAASHQSNSTSQNTVQKNVGQCSNDHQSTGQQKTSHLNSDQENNSHPSTALQNTALQSSNQSSSSHEDIDMQSNFQKEHSSHEVIQDMSVVSVVTADKATDEPGTDIPIYATVDKTKKKKVPTATLR